jgi:hypothetical protein
MTAYDYVIAREFNRLLAEAGQRELTANESFLLDVLTPWYLRLEEEDLRPVRRRA